MSRNSFQSNLLNHTQPDADENIFWDQNKLKEHFEMPA